ncbi:MAG TPA: hypothetical protein PLA43_04885 [Bryobacteraceae bacterium]|nr:hypothetical protein [Bryobacteraceae bacterium]HOL69824.1 hypothetical protein [Bryobacteraceae bacterium]HOQ45197.1 hypothetical protein [Bryobacteraceae bacterium]HPU71269.1 hypothetical protein [Bryobacteraceae bacterium]
MGKLLLSCCLFSAIAFSQYKMEPAGAPPSELAPEIRNALQKDGAKISGPNGVVCEVWFRTSVPAEGNSEQNVSFTQIKHGTLLGAIRFPTKGLDRRGNPIKPGVYTMRLSFYPVDGAHQGIAPTRDFVLLSPAESDTDLNATPSYKELVAMSQKASGITHPATLNVWKPDSAEPAALKQEGEDWVLYSSLGDMPIAIILIGTFAG